MYDKQPNKGQNMPSLPPTDRRIDGSPHRDLNWAALKIRGCAMFDD